MLKGAIRTSSLEYNIREDVLASIIWQESRGNPFAVRYEPAFYAKYLLNKDRNTLSGFVPSPIPTLETEKVLRATSFGLMQVMGETIRWFTKTTTPYLTAYLDPDLNLDAGASYLAHLLQKTHGNYEQALRLYNGSRLYPPLIMDHVKKKSYLNLFA